MIALYCMNQKGLAVLTRLVSELGSSVISYVVTAKNSSVENDFHDEILAYCQREVITTFRRQDNVPAGARISFSVGWRWLIRDAPNLVIFHDSLLPRYRGFNPLVSYLLNKEPELGVTAVLAEEKFDTGPIVEQISVKAVHPMKIQDAIDIVIPLYCQLAVTIAKQALEFSNSNRLIQLVSRQQDEAKATYSVWRDEQDYILNWSQSAEELQRHIFAVGEPYLGARSNLDGRSVRIMDAQIISDLKIENRAPGKIFRLDDGNPVVICGQGLLKVTKLIEDESRQSLLPYTRLRARFT